MARCDPVSAWLNHCKQHLKMNGPGCDITNDGKCKHWFIMGYKAATASISKHMDFGDYCSIEMKRHSCDNEFYTHKVIGMLNSNAYVDAPVQSPATETIHKEIVPVVACICCGVSEREVLRYRVVDVTKQTSNG